MPLYLIRHPRPSVEAGVCYGRLDLPLAAPVDAFVLPAGFVCQTSPLQRCRLLAQALHPAPQVDTRLVEFDFGRWEGRSWDEIGADALDRWIASGYSGIEHGGEDLAQLRARVLDWANDASLSTKPVVAVTHAGVIRTLLAELNGWSVAQSFEHPLPFGGITVVDWKCRTR